MSLASSSFAGQALAFRQAVQRKPSVSTIHIVAKESRIGKQPIPVPAKVEVTINGSHVKVKVRQFSAHSDLHSTHYKYIMYIYAEQCIVLVL